MDCNLGGLNRTIKQFEAENIYTIGAGNTQEEAEKPFVLNYNGQNIQYLMHIGIDVLCIENTIFMQ